MAEMKVDVKYIKEHVGVMNNELGQCVERLNSLEKKKAEANGIKQGEKKVWKYLTAGVGTFGVIVTILYYLSLMGIHILQAGAV